MHGLRRAMTLLGGPFGIALLAAEGLAFYALSAGEAADETDRLAQSARAVRLEELRARISSAQAGLSELAEAERRTRREFRGASLDARLAEIERARARLKDDLRRFREGIVKINAEALTKEGDFAFPTGTPSDIERRATKAALEIHGRVEERIAQLTLDRIALVRRAEAAQVDELNRLREQGAADAAVIEAAILAVRKAARTEIAEISKEDAKADRRRHEEAAKAYAAGMADIEAASLDLAGPYDRALAEVDRWRTGTVAALGKLGLAHEEYAARVAEVHGIAHERLARLAVEESEERLSASRHWRDGAIRALRDVADESGDAARSMEDGVRQAASSMEDAIAEFATTGKLSFSGLADSIIADLARIAGAPRYHRGGLAGQLRADEIPAILRRGEGVFTREQMAALSPAPPPVHIEIVNQGGPLREVGNEVRFDAGRMFISLAVDNVEHGRLGQTIEQVFDVRRRTV